MIKPLTSLRFLFALMVFLSHFSFFGFKPETTLGILYNNIFSEGFIGVSFFFILSGFILTYNYKLKIRDGEISNLKFWIARFARIYPLYFISIFLSFPQHSTEMLKQSFYWLFKLILNLLLLQSFIPVPDIYFSFNSPAWSISTEAAFYISFPFIITTFLITKKRRNLLALIFIIACLFIILYMTIEKSSFARGIFYINPLIRIFDFCLGILIYELYILFKANVSKGKIFYTFLEFLSLLIFYMFFNFHNSVPLIFRYSVFYWLPNALIILIFSFQRGFFSKILSQKFFILLGEISFSFYLLHILVIINFLAINRHFFHLENQYLIISIVFIITLILSYITFTFIEKPLNILIKEKLSGLLSLTS